MPLSLLKLAMASVVSMNVKRTKLTVKGLRNEL
jgi:hypothetical protein